MLVWYITKQSSHQILELAYFVVDKLILYEYAAAPIYTVRSTTLLMMHHMSKNYNDEML